jgi:4-hydroxybenzoate polyprenyltransferase
VAILSWGGAIWLVRPDLLGLMALLPVSVHLLWQALTLRPDDGDDALAKFRSNRFAGLLMAAACLVIGSAG